MHCVRVCVPTATTDILLLFITICRANMMQYENPGERLKDDSTCGIQRAELKMCLLKSECCKDRKRTPRECLKAHDGTVPQECYALKEAFFECKRSMVDMRRRFRGPKK